MTPLGHGILTGISEVDDPAISDAMSKMLASSTHCELGQTVLEMSVLITALCNAVGECANTTSRDVLDCVLSR